MKATVEIPDELYRRAKIKAAMEGVKIKDMIAEGLSVVLESNNSAKKGKRISLPLVKTGKPGSMKIDEELISRIETELDAAG
ncbi:hypothetical protein QQ056_16115 [Oscillatoria laete-virens NRMC-F 0139]|nr:hypothetical protein [Oscillatoria laete-virens]MDL5055064.1 hypothetical protein [Oscillatoria laete-virens NRMC-F 0139]